jgi:hypothetical protein
MKPPIGSRSTRVASPSARRARGAHCEAELKELMPMAAWYTQYKGTNGSAPQQTMQGSSLRGSAEGGDAAAW